MPKVLMGCLLGLLIGIIGINWWFNSHTIIITSDELNSYMLDNLKIKLMQIYPDYAEEIEQTNFDPNTEVK